VVFRFAFSERKERAEGAEGRNSAEETKGTLCIVATIGIGVEGQQQLYHELRDNETEQK
jgi:hypothetical protein